jgi:thiol-disulfide isomerase/thioredoxin
MITVYKFSAEWCKNGKMYDSIFDKISQEFNNTKEIEFKKVDVEECVELTNKYSIKHIPATVIETNDKILFIRIGIISESDLREQVNKLFNSHVF